VLVDAAQGKDLVLMAQQEFGLVPQSLFLPEVRGSLQHVAPSVFRVDARSKFLDRWAERLGNNAGILLISAATPEALQEHLRRTFVVMDESGQEYFFRYYDPRVLRVFLPTCSSQQLVEFFGPVDEFIVERETGDLMSRFRCAGGELVEDQLRLVPVEGHSPRATARHNAPGS
jgi:hypothetical protein